MQAYLVRRLLALIPTLFFASVIVFVTVLAGIVSVMDLGFTKLVLLVFG